MSIYQQSFDSSIFLGEILDILDMTFYSSSGDFYGEYDIFMSYAAGDLTIDFENNISQPWTYFSSVNLATDIVNSELKVSGLFNYDSTIGDLIIGLYRTSSTNSGNFLHHGSDPRIQRAYKHPNGVQFAHKDYGVNVTFNTRVANVPEPSTLAIFAFGMIGLASRRFKKQS